jgi:hypothetical protein
MRAAPSYGARSRLTAANAGIRLTARTYGKARIGTYAAKADGHITVDCDAERLVANILSIDPRVRSFRQQHNVTSDRERAGPCALKHHHRCRQNLKIKY